MLKETITEKRKERHSVTQEDFTPENVTKLMLLRIPNDAFTDFNRTVLDNSCGEGNLLVEVLRRRLTHTTNVDEAIDAISTIYGVELMADNVQTTRERLYDIITERYPEIKESNEVNYKVRAIIRNRIQWHDSLTFDYENFPVLHKNDMKPRAKRLNVGFKEPRKCATYPMWSDPNTK